MRLLRFGSARHAEAPAGAAARGSRRRSSSWTGLVLLLGIGAGGGAAADSDAVAPGDTLRVPLRDCVERALSAGEEMRIAAADYDLAHAAYLSTRSTALPQLTFSSSYTRQVKSVFEAGDTGAGIEPFEPDPSAPDSARIRALENALPDAGLTALTDLFKSTPLASENTWVMYVGVTQKLLEGGSIHASIQAARHAMTAADRLRADRGDEMVLETRQAYLGALLADRAVRIAELGVEQADSQLRRVRLRQEAGQASEFDLLQAEVQRDNQVPIVKRARNRREIAYLELRRLANLPLGVPMVLTTPLLDDAAVPRDPAAVDTTDLVPLALRASGVTALEEVLRARDRAVTVAAKDRWPGLSLFADFSRQAFPRSVLPKAGEWRDDVKAGVRLNWNLFDGLRTRGAVRQSLAERLIAEQNLRRAREAVREAVVQSREELERAALDLEARARTARVAKRALELANLRYEEGASSLIEIADVRIAYQVAETNAAQARHDYFVALARLERYTGRPLFTNVAQPVEGWR